MNNNQLIGIRNFWEAANKPAPYLLQFTAFNEWADWGNFATLADAKVAAVKDMREGRDYRVVYQGQAVWFM